VKAVVLQPGRGAVIEEMPVPRSTPGSIVVEMRACGMCGSDLEKIRGAYTAAPPVIGHEAVGIVAGIGAGVQGIHRGDRLFPHHHVNCGRCRECRSGSPTMCVHYRATNLEPGGFSQFFRVPAWNVRRGGVLKLPQNVSFEAGSFIEPAACCLRALGRAKVREGDDALVAGAGPTGLLFLQLLPRFGAGRVFVSEVSELRRGVATRFGADASWNPRTTDVPSEVRARTKSRGVDVAVVASGHPDALAQSLRSVRAGGTVVLFGVPEVGSRLDFDVSELVTREISVVPSNAATDDETRKALDMIAKREIDVEALVTHRFTLDRFADAVETATRTECVKALVTP